MRSLPQMHTEMDKLLYYQHEFWEGDNKYGVGTPYENVLSAYVKYVLVDLLVGKFQKW